VRSREHKLAKRLRRREPGAYEAVYERFAPAVFGMLLQILRDRATAEDVLQQVFVEVWQRAEQYDPERAGLLTWIMTIARSRAIDALRRRVPEPRDPAGSIALLEASQDDSAEALDMLLDTWRMAHFLARLPASEADLLRRRFYEDQTQTQIAEATGIPLGTVKARMLSGLESLRSMMEDEQR
jgi:RNA polymerase sigma-70 factor (ECF subfamily)